MAGLVEILYPPPDRRRTPLSTIRWWESRRVVFNKIVGAVGVGTLGVGTLIDALPPHPLFMPLDMVLLSVAVYIALVNACYTLGWMTELLVRGLWGRGAPSLGPILFRQGVIFSIGLTLLLLLFPMFGWIIRVIGWIVP